MNAPQQQMQAFHQQAYQVDIRQAAQPTQTSLAQNQQAAEPTQTSEPPLPPQPPPVLTAGEEREIPAGLKPLAKRGWLGPSYWGEVDIASITGIPGEDRSRQTMEDTVPARRDSAQAPTSAQLQPNQAPPAAAPMSMLPPPPVNTEPATSHISTAMAPDPPNIQQASNAQPASKIPPIAMTSQPPPASAQPAYNPQSISTAPPLQSSQPVRQFAPPFDPRPFGKLQRTATGHWSRLKQPPASPSAVSNEQPATNPPSDSTASQLPPADAQPASNPPSNTMASRQLPADAQPDADRLLTAMDFPALDRQPASNMPTSIAMAPPPQHVYVPQISQLPLKPHWGFQRNPRETIATYYNPPANYNRQPASNASRTAVAPQPPSAIDGQPAPNAPQTAVAPRARFASDGQPASNAPRTATAPQPPSANEHSGSRNSSRTAAPSARTTHPSANSYSNPNAQPAPNDPSAPMTPPSQLAQPVVKPEPVSDAQQASATSSIPKAPDSQPAQPGSNPASISSTPPDPTQRDEYPHLNFNVQPAPNHTEFMPSPQQLVHPVAKPYPFSNTLPTSNTSSISKGPEPRPAQLASDPAPASIQPPQPAQPYRYHQPPMNAAQFCQMKLPQTQTHADRIVLRELRTLYDSLTYAQMNILRNKYLAVLLPLERDEHEASLVDPLLWYLRSELRNERLRLTIDDPDDWNHDPVHLAAVRVKKQIELAEAMTKPKEEPEKKIKVEGAAVSQPNGMPINSGQQTGMLGGLQLGNAMNGGGRMSFHPSNVPVGSGQYYGAPGGQQLGNAVSAGGSVPSQPSNIPVSSGPYFGAANGQQLGNPTNGMMVGQPIDVPVNSGQHYGAVNRQQLGTASNDVAGSSTNYFQSVHKRPDYLPGSYQMDEWQVNYQKRSMEAREKKAAAARENKVALARAQQLGDTKEERYQKSRLMARGKRAAVARGREAELAREQQLGDSVMGSGQQFGSVPGHQQWNNMNGPPMGYPAGMQPYWGPPIIAPMQQVGALGWPQQGRAMSEQQQGYAVAGPWPGKVTLADRSLLPGGVGSRQNPEVLD
ncbi:hypothetical protein LTR27_005619 [Elasticomyces elasticus]|nr:hypothetical protein LTR27_005619 [Elasticomyces elasticus]